MLVHVNAYNLRCLERHPVALRAAGEGDLFLLEGIGLKWMLALSGRGWLPDCNGTDTVPEACRDLARRKGSVFLLGGMPGVAERAARALESAYPGLRAAGWHHGFFPAREESDVVRVINGSGAHLLLVGMGCPRQEEFLFRHAGHLAPAVGWAVGGLLDYLAGETVRAPRGWRRLRLEWLYRCIGQPRRLGPRVVAPFLGLFPFLIRDRLRCFSLP